MTEFKQTDFEKKVKVSLNADVESLDADTRQQLAAARRKALNQPALNQPTKKNWQQYWLPAGSLALCSLLAVFIYVNPQPDNSQTNVANNQSLIETQTETTDQVAAFELLIEADDDETSDPDFYLWADEMLAAETVQDAA